MLNHNVRILCINNFYKRTEFSVRRMPAVGFRRSSELVRLEFEHLIFCSKNNDINKTNVCVKTLLGIPWFWFFCYKSIKRDQRVNSLVGLSLFSNLNSEIFNDLTLDFFFKLSKTIACGNFTFGLTKKTGFAKPNANLRLYRIVDLHDKIVQRGMVFLLEAVSKHKFLACSFGFRKSHSCESVFSYIRKKAPLSLWAIKGDVSKSFDHFNHKKLVSVVRKKHISEQIFIDLLYKAIKNKIIYIRGQFSKIKLGVSQGSVINLILYTIYLHELDEYVFGGSMLAKFRKSVPVNINHYYTKFLKQTKNETLEGEFIRKEKGKCKMWEYFQKVRAKKIKLAKKLNIVTRQFKECSIKLVYSRYLTDFIIFVWGNQNDCFVIKKRVKTFLKGDLGLVLAEEKIKITYLKKKKANFLGFQISQFSESVSSSKKDNNFTEKLNRTKINLKLKLPLLRTSRLRITFSMGKTLKKLANKNMVRFKHGKYVPTSSTLMLQFQITNIVYVIRMFFRKISEYYRCADNRSSVKSLYNYFGRYIVAMTIAHKIKSKIPKVFKKYGSDVCIIDDKDNPLVEFESLINTEFKKKFFKKLILPPSGVDRLLAGGLTWVKTPMVIWPCIVLSGINGAYMRSFKYK